MDLWLMRADGTQQKQMTNLGGASFAPAFFPNGQRIIFSSNYEHLGTSQFELYAIDRDGTKVEPSPPPAASAPSRNFLPTAKN